MDWQKLGQWHLARGDHRRAELSLEAGKAEAEAKVSVKLTSGQNDNFKSKPHLRVIDGSGRKDPSEG
ncbi:MAG: hypothetical protein QM523_09880 [Candidatus Pacebacteria bacterium]|nr:hypothetical protein [Candidatus Paceibacterota bacterium]